MYDASNRKDVRKAEKAARLAASEDADAIRKIMSDTFGRAWMWRRLSAARIFDDPFTGDPLVEAYNKGNRNFGTLLLSDIMLHCPEQYLIMTREAHVRRINDDNDDRTAGSNDDNPGAEHNGSQNVRRDIEGPDSTAHESDGDEDRTYN